MPAHKCKHLTTPFDVSCVAVVMDTHLCSWSLIMVDLLSSLFTELCSVLTNALVSPSAWATCRYKNTSQIHNVATLQTFTCRW